jgi:hypothetical protein
MAYGWCWMKVSLWQEAITKAIPAVNEAKPEAIFQKPSLKPSHISLMPSSKPSQNLP